MAAAAAIYALFAVWAVGPAAHRVDRGAARRGEPTLPPVSVLKPLCGDEPGLHGNLRSFCLQNHPCFQLLFGVRDPADPAIAVVRRLQAEFPTLDIQLLIEPQVHGANLKVSNLRNLLGRARHDWLVLADSDVAVGPDYLRRVTSPLADPGVGVVTCLYRGEPRAGPWSRLGAQFINEWFVPSVRVAHAFGSTRFSFGATIALRREALEAAGGFPALDDLLADDFWLGELTRRRGLRTVLSDVVVTTDVTDRTLSDLWAHELRWLRTIRAVEPLGFFAAAITFTFPVVAAGLALARSELCLGIAAVGAVARIGLHYRQRETPVASSPAAEVILVPWRDTLLLAAWAAAQTGSRVTWRNQRLDAAVGPRGASES